MALRRQRRKRSKAEVEAHKRCRAEVTAAQRCWICGRPERPERLDVCHLIPAQRLRAHTSTLPDEERWPIVYDPRICVAGHRGCHHRLDSRHHTIHYGELPNSAIEFAEEHRLSWSLERDYMVVDF